MLLFLVLPAGLPQSGKLPVLNLLTVHRTKIRFFTPQGRLVASIHVKFGSADRHLGPLGCAIFHINRPLLYLLLTLFIVYLSKKFRRGQGRLCSSKGGGGACAMAQWHNGQSKPVSRSRHFSTLNISESTLDIAMITIEHQ